jgi:hypothetical protein
MSQPTLRTIDKSLYIPAIEELEVQTRGNLKRTLKELLIDSGTELIVADTTLPATITVKLIIGD